MKKKNLLVKICKSLTIFLLSIVLVLCLLTSCENLSKRTVILTIPDHAWETVSKHKLWYELSYTEGTTLVTRFIGQNTRTLEVKVDSQKQVFFLCKPLGKFHGFGGWISPIDSENKVELTQEKGVLVEALLKLDLICLEDLNANRILEHINETCSDIRQINQTKLLLDIANNRLKDTSFSQNKAIDVSEGLDIPFGLYYSEFLRDPSIYTSFNEPLKLKLYPGKTNFYNFEKNFVLCVTVQDNGAVSSFITEGLL